MNDLHPVHDKALVVLDLTRQRALREATQNIIILNILNEIDIIPTALCPTVSRNIMRCGQLIWTIKMQ